MLKEKPVGSYVLAVQTPIYRLSEQSFAVESAFSHHLKQLREQFAGRISKFVVIAPEMSEESYRSSPSLTIIGAESGIDVLPAYPADVSVTAFWTKHAGRIWREVTARVGDASVVHSGLASDLWRPLVAFVNLAAWRCGKPLMFVVDIDFRKNTKRLRTLGIWSLKSYLTNRFFHDPIRWLQVWLAVRVAKLVLLKSPRMVRDFGAGRPHVKNFLDTAFSTEHVLSADDLDERIAALHSDDGPLRLVYFGRLVPYKGLHLAIDAIGIAKARGKEVQLAIIGDGPSLPDLRRRVEDAGLSANITFMPPVVYGAPLFERLSRFHASIACPLTEDTPRAAIDSMARGLPLVAFDLDYFEGLAEMSGAVTLARWPSAERLAEALMDVSLERQRLVSQTRHAVEFARTNTQQIWLERRLAWVEEYLLTDPPVLPRQERSGAFA